MTYGTPVLFIFFLREALHCSAADIFSGAELGVGANQRNFSSFFFFLFRCNAFHILALSQSCSLFHFEPVLPTESGFISTGGHALMRLNVGTENREHDATYGWILSLLHRPREDQLLQISCLPLGFKTLLWGRGGRRVTSTFPQGRSIFCPNLFQLVCKNEEKNPVASASCGVHSAFSHDSKYPMIRVEWAVHVHGNALNAAEDV